MTKSYQSKNILYLKKRRKTRCFTDNFFMCNECYMKIEIQVILELQCKLLQRLIELF
jgi:hypothetical protein